MRRIQLLVAVLTLVLLVTMSTREAGQTQGPGGSDPGSPPAGTAPIGQDEAAVLPAGPAEEEDVEAPAQSYNATLRVPVAGLKPRTSDVEWHTGGEGGCTYASSGDVYTWWSTPLYLPQESTLRYFRMYYNDQNNSVNCDAYLTVYDLYGRVVTEWGISSSGTGLSYVTTPELDHVVDYENYSYVIHWRPNDSGTDMQVCGFRVYYEKPSGLTYLPMVGKND